MITSELDRRLLNDYQRKFPLTGRPFRTLGEELGSDETTVLARLRRFTAAGAVSRIGPVFRPNTIGSSTLAAMSVPEALMPGVADTVSGYPEVNHNYEREHRFNLWFVITAPSRACRDAVLVDIERATGLAVMSLPLVRDYHIDLGFDLDFAGAAPLKSTPAPAAPRPPAWEEPTDTRVAGDLVSALQAGLPLVAEPYREIARRTGLSEQEVVEFVRVMLGRGVIKRFGVVVRHHELGYRANAMCVWDVPDALVDDLGERLAREPAVTLCYRRPRRSPDWPYNLFSMIHGKERSMVMEQVDALVDRFRLHHVPRSVLFSRRRFKQRGAYYRRPDMTAGGGTRRAHG